MSEIESDVRTVLVDYICDEENCGGCVVKDSSKPMLVMSDPPEIPHRCMNCGKEYMFANIVYPTVKYKRV